MMFHSTACAACTCRSEDTVWLVPQNCEANDRMPPWRPKSALMSAWKRKRRVSAALPAGKESTRHAHAQRAHAETAHRIYQRGVGFAPMD